MDGAQDGDKDQVFVDGSDSHGTREGEVLHQINMQKKIHA